MQKFTRNLTREIELGGERVSVTLDADGVTLRPVGSRKPPHTVSWAGVLCAATTGAAPTADQLAAAVAALKKGGEKAPGAESPVHAEAPAHGGHHAETPAPAATHHEHTEAPAHAAHHTESSDHGGHHAKEADHGGHHTAGSEHGEHHAKAPVAPSAEHIRSAPVLNGLAAVLARIDHWLAKHRTGFHNGLLPGATDAECDTLASALGVALPGDLRTLLKWHNGQDVEAPGAFDRNFFLLSTAQIAETKKDLEAEPRNGWKPGLIPFLDDDQDNCVCLDTTQSGMPVVECWRGQSHVTTTAPSLAAWLEGFAVALEKGEYVEDPERGGFQRKS